MSITWIIYISFCILRNDNWKLLVYFMCFNFMPRSAQTTKRKIDDKSCPQIFRISIYYCVFVCILKFNMLLFFSPLRINERLRAARQQHGFVVVRWQSITSLKRSHDTKQSAQQTNANVIQAPSAAHDEVVLCDQSKSWRERSEAIGTKNGFIKASAAGEKRNELRRKKLW